MSRRSSSQKESPDSAARDGEAPVAGNGSAGEGGEAADAARPSQIAEIDTAPIDALLKIAKQQEDLKALVEKADATREKVSAAVYKRVKADYDKRLDALEAEARPLRKQARDEHGRLQPIHDRLAKGVEEARLDKEELEFRHEVGEIPDDAFEERNKVAVDLLAQREKDFKEADELKQRFLGVMGPEEEPAPAPLSARTTQMPAEAGNVPEPLSDADLGLPPPPEPEVVEIDDSPTNPDGGEATAYIQASTLPPMAPPPLPGGGAPPEGRTMVMRFARFVAEDSNEEFQLGLRTSVGRTPDNDICINNPAVSRRHCVISVAEGGYTIADLKSGNGTYVNDDKLTDQRPLVEGDRVKIGPTTFVFHLPE
jgi:hypothetical protein